MTCDCWSQLHQQRVKNVDVDARRMIDQLVGNSWEQLLEKAKGQGGMGQ